MLDNSKLQIRFRGEVMSNEELEAMLNNKEQATDFCLSLKADVNSMMNQKERIDEDRFSNCANLIWEIERRHGGIIYEPPMNKLLKFIDDTKEARKKNNYNFWKLIFG